MTRMQIWLGWAKHALRMQRLAIFMVMGLVCMAMPAQAANDVTFYCSKVPGATTANPNGYGIKGPPPNGQKLLEAVNVLNAVITKIAAMTSCSNPTDGCWKDPFKKITNNAEFRGAVSAAVLLYLVVYAVLIIFNLTTISWYDGFIRLAKIGVVYYLLFGGGMADIIASFVFGGMNQLINAYYDATVGSATLVALKTVPGGLTTKPLAFLVTPLNTIFQMKFVMMVLGLFLGGVAGAGMMLFIVYGVFYFLLAIVGAVATYIKAMLGLYILFAISPIFVACLLFDQTRRLFDGWVTMVLSFALQPVFVFAFLGFFMLMITGVMQPLLKIESCYGPVYDPGFTEINWFFPVDIDHLKTKYTTTMKSGQGMYSDIGLVNSDLWKLAGLDLKVIDVLMFVMLSTLAFRYSTYVQQIATEMVGGGVSITTTGTQIAQSLQNNGLDPASLTKRAFGAVADTGSAAMKMGSGLSEMARQGSRMSGAMEESQNIVNGKKPD